MTKNIALTIFLILVSGTQHLNAQTFTIYYDGSKSIHDCRIISVSEYNVGVEYTPFLPGIYARKNISMADITGIREFSRANQYTPYLTLLGSYLGVKYYFHERGPIDEMTLSERFASWLDTPINFISAVCLGGGVGYLAGHFLLGGNLELITLEKLPNKEKQTILAQFVDQDSAQYQIINEP